MSFFVEKKLLIESISKEKEVKEMELLTKQYELEIERTKLIYKLNSILTADELSLNYLTAASGFFNETTLVVNVVPFIDGKILKDWKIIIDLETLEVSIVDNAYLEQGMIQKLESHNLLDESELKVWKDLETICETIRIAIDA